MPAPTTTGVAPSTAGPGLHPQAAEDPQTARFMQAVMQTFQENQGRIGTDVKRMGDVDFDGYAVPKPIILKEAPEGYSRNCWLPALIALFMRRGKPLAHIPQEVLDRWDELEAQAEEAATGKRPEFTPTVAGSQRQLYASVEGLLGEFKDVESRNRWQQTIIGSTSGDETGGRKKKAVLSRRWKFSESSKDSCLEAHYKLSKDKGGFSRHAVLDTIPPKNGIGQTSIEYSRTRRMK